VIEIVVVVRLTAMMMMLS
ncbi:hypothetical protein A2U01_0054662, partial [Trifolium medium]|nr:hypothetical protein [Trifolium medium]